MCEKKCLSKTIASFSIIINMLFAGVCVFFSILLYTFSIIVKFSDNYLMFVILCSGVFLAYFVSYLFVAVRVIPLSLIGDLISAIYFPNWLHQSKVYSIFFIVSSVVVLWCPVFIVSFMIPFSSISYISVLTIYFLLWAVILRAIDYAERQIPIEKADTLEEQEEKEIKFLAVWIIFIGLCCLELFFAFIKYIFGGFSIENMYFTVKQKQYTIMAIAGLLFALLIGLLYIRLSTKHRTILEKMQLHNQIEQKQLYIDLVTEKYKTLRHYQHDFKQHLTYIQHLAENNETQLIQDYIKTIYADLQGGVIQKLSGNQTLDILLSDKLFKANSKKVTLQIDYQPNVILSFLSAPDLCIILGNLLDNAITAAEASEKKQIDCIFCRKSDYYTIIRIENSCDIVPIMINGIPQTIQVGEQHGYGIKNVLKCVQKYGGNCLFRYNEEKNIFCVNLLLSSNDKKEK